MKKSAITFFLFFVLSGVVFGFSSVLALGLHGADKTAGAAGLTSYPDTVTEIAGTFIGTLLSFIAVFFFILMVYGGFIWMVAHGNEEQEKKALRTIVAAIIGMTIIVAAYALTKLIFTRLNNTNAPLDGSKCTEQGEGWSCISSESCQGLTEGTAEEKWESCDAGDSDTCKTNLCPGNKSIVCCK